RAAARAVVAQWRWFTAHHRPEADHAVHARGAQRSVRKALATGRCAVSKTFPDQMTDLGANEEARRFYEEKVRAIIDDPAVADLLIPQDHPIGTKRIC